MKSRNVFTNTEGMPKIAVRSDIAEEEKNAGPSPAEIRQRAFEIYIERGGIHGCDLDDWLQTERELQEKYKNNEKGTKRAEMRWGNDLFGNSEKECNLEAAFDSRLVSHPKNALSLDSFPGDSLRIVARSLDRVVPDLRWHSVCSSRPRTDGGTPKDFQTGYGRVGKDGRNSFLPNLQRKTAC
jgi:Protein of unknown function (DUF2934)